MEKKFLEQKLGQVEQGLQKRQEEFEQIKSLLFDETLKNSSCKVMNELLVMVAIICPLLTVLPVCTKMVLITPPNDAVAFALF